MSGKPADVSKIIERVDRSGGYNACWPWTARRDAQGYGRIKHAMFRTELAHRAVYELLVGAIPAGMCVCHTCDNPPCCNPKHLWLGTIAQNNRDMVAKRRHVPRAKLTEEQVKQLRSMAPMSRAQREAFALRHGMGLTAIHDVLRGASWKHV